MRRARITQTSDRGAPRGARGWRWALVALALALAASLVAERGYFTRGTSIYYVTSLGSSTVAYLSFQLEAFQRGDFVPHSWTPRIHTGIPVHTGLAVYNPLLLAVAPFHALGDALEAYGILLRVLGGLGVFLLCRRARVGPTGALAATAVFSVNPFFSAVGEDPQFGAGVVAAPWLVLCLDGLLAAAEEPWPRRLRWALWLALVASLAFLATNVQTHVFLLALLLLPYAALRLLGAPGGARVALRVGPYLLLAAALHAALVAFEWIPTLGVLAAGNRVVSSAIAPRLAWYAGGLVGLGLLIGHARRARWRGVRAASVLAVGVALLFLAGPESPWYLFYGNYALPRRAADYVFDLQPVTHLTTLLPLGLVLLALVRGRGFAAPRTTLWVFSLAWALSHLLAMGYRSDALGWLPFGEQLKDWRSLGPDSWVPLYANRYRFLVLPGLALGVALGADELLRLLRRRWPELSPGAGRAVAAALVLAVAADTLWVDGVRTLRTGSLRYLEPRGPVAELLAGLGPTERVIDVYDHVHALTGEDRARALFGRKTFLAWLMPVYTGASTFSRVGVGVLDRHSVAYNDLAMPAYFGLEPGKPLAPLVDLAGVGWVLALRSVEPPPGLRLERVGADYALYRNPEAFPRVMLVPQVVPVPEDEVLARMAAASPEELRTRVFVATADAARLGLDAPVPAATGDGASGEAATGEARITDYGAERVRIRYEAPQPRVLLLTDSYHPDWKAYLDGSPRPVVRADSIYRGLAVPAGRHEVVFRYEPADAPWAGLALAAALASGLVLAALALFERR